MYVFPQTEIKELSNFVHIMSATTDNGGGNGEDESMTPAPARLLYV